MTLKLPGFHAQILDGSNLVTLNQTGPMSPLTEREKKRERVRESEREREREREGEREETRRREKAGSKKER